MWLLKIPPKDLPGRPLQNPGHLVLKIGIEKQLAFPNGYNQLEWLDKKATSSGKPPWLQVHNGDCWKMTKHPFFRNRFGLVRSFHYSWLLFRSDSMVMA